MRPLPLCVLVMVISGVGALRAADEDQDEVWGAESPQKCFAIYGQALREKKWHRALAMMTSEKRNGEFISLLLKNNGAKEEERAKIKQFDEERIAGRLEFEDYYAAVMDLSFERLKGRFPDGKLLDLKIEDGRARAVTNTPQTLPVYFVRIGKTWLIDEPTEDEIKSDAERIGLKLKVGGADVKPAQR